MRVLVACEFSGIVRDAFIERGHDAISWFGREDGRPERFFEALRFFRLCLKANAPLIAVENPLPHKVARLGMGEPSLMVRPWWFGQLSNKAVCLWTYGLPPLVASHIVPRSLWTKPSKKGWMGATSARRSIAPVGIAKAMAKQWG